VGIDLGKRSFEAAIVGSQGKVEQYNGVINVRGRQALYRRLRVQDKVALKAGGMAFTMAKEIEAAVRCRVYVVNLSLVPPAWQETDRTVENSLKLAYMVKDLHEEQLPTVAAPSDGEMMRKNLAAGLQRERQIRNNALSRLHGLFLKCGERGLIKKDLMTPEQRQTAMERLHGPERNDAEYLLRCLELYERRIGEMEKEMGNGQ